MTREHVFDVLCVLNRLSRRLDPKYLRDDIASALDNQVNVSHAPYSAAPGEQADCTFVIMDTIAASSGNTQAQIGSYTCPLDRRR